MILVGDAVIGSPRGSLSLLPDQKYGDVRKAALGLRRLLAFQPEILLVGDGASIFSGATKLLAELLRQEGGIDAYRINVDELTFEPYKGRGDYHCLEAEVGYWIGAQKLGYCVVTLPPGAKVCPLHNHAQSEELFFVLEGRPTIRALDGAIQCRKGDFIAFPTGPSGTHQLLNESDADATVLLLGTEGPDEVCFYPDSNKVLIDPGRLILRASPALDYYDGE
ncbi:MAG: cupin domain-containing protein [Candidatus Eremiobacteraeota bacterium]|nr:cupin domain-containing protein [Candidatus Eremiobacteraeota bacterium]